MNHVERFRALMSFRPVDRLPRIEWATWWDQTIARWKAEGLPADLEGTFAIHRYLGLDPYRQHWFKHKAESCPEPAHHGAGLIADLHDYQALLPQLYPPQDAALEMLADWATEQACGELVVWITLEGFFWFPRTLLGIERHLYAYYDQPALLHRINQDLANYHLTLLRALRDACRPTFMTFAEDMSYNHGPMLSQQLFEEFVAPYYRQVVPAIQEMGTLAIVDTDGDCSRMIPWMMAAGIEGVLPLERQAGVDANALRAQFPTLRMIGHYDKMVMPHGEAAMRAEFERLAPVMRSGGYIPGVDHQTPPGVSLEAYRVYLRLLEEYTAGV